MIYSNPLIVRRLASEHTCRSDPLSSPVRGRTRSGVGPFAWRALLSWDHSTNRATRSRTFERA